MKDIEPKHFPANEEVKLEHIKKALASPDVPKYYANGFANGLGIGDIVITFSNNFSPVAVLNLSYTMAKSLSIRLAELIKSLEESTGNTIMTTDEIQKALTKGKE